MRFRSVILGVCLLLAGAALASEEDPPAKGKDGKPSAKDDSGKETSASGKSVEKKAGHGSTLSLDKLKLPANAVILLCEEAAEALRLLPKAVVLSPEKYQEMLEQIEQLRRAAKPEKAETPSSCKLSIRAGPDQATIQIDYEFRTERPRAIVALGCQKAWPTSAILDDDEAPSLELVNDSWQILVDSPGTHRLRLELVAPVSTRAGRANERGVELGLPRAAITVMEKLTVAGMVSEIRFGSRVQKATGGPAESEVKNIALGPAERLDASWRLAEAGMKQGPPLLTARARTIARFEETQLFTDVELNLEVLRGSTALWRVFTPLPPQATLEKPRVEDDRIQDVTYPDRQSPYLVVRFREPSSEPLKIALQIRQPRIGSLFPIGPFAVFDALPQTGSIEVRSPADLRLRYRLQQEASQRELAEDARTKQTVASFVYWNLTASDGKSPPQPPLAVEVETIKGSAEARVTHTLRPDPTWRNGTGPWLVVSRFEIAPIRTGVDRLDLALPEGYTIDQEVGPIPADLVEDFVEDRETKRLLVKLAQRQFRPFTVTLTGFSTSAPAAEVRQGEPRSLSVGLPTPVDWSVDRGPNSDRKTAFLDRGGQVAVSMPDGYEIVPAGGASGGRQPAREATWTAERFPERASWGWRKQSLDLLVSYVIDVDLEEKAARVLQRATLESRHTLPGSLVIQFPAILGKPRATHQGMPVSLDETSPGYYSVSLDGVVKGQTIQLAYTVPLAKPSAEWAFARVVGASSQIAKAMVWNNGAAELELGPLSWEECPLEADDKRPRLPTLVARGEIGQPFSLTLRDSRRAAPIVVERVLHEANIQNPGKWTILSHFLISSFPGRFLEFSFAEGAAREGAQVWVNGKQASPTWVQDGGPNSSGRMLRVPIDADSQGKVLAIAALYDSEPTVPTSWGFQTPRIAGVQIPGALLLGRTRWAIAPRDRHLAMSLAPRTVVEQSWRWMGLMPVLAPSRTIDELRSWCGDDGSLGFESDAEPGLLCARSDLEPLQLVSCPRQLWLFLCSLTVLSAGWFVLGRVHSRTFLWGAAIVAVMAGAFFAIGVPDIAPLALMGCVPGLAILSVLLIVSAAMSRRSTDDLATMHGFSRVKAGSSLIRGNLARPLEPSTVDQPAKRGSSIGPEIRPEAELPDRGRDS